MNGVVIGDRGRIAATAGGDFIRIETTDEAIGGDDAITLGDGVTTVLGGRGSDTVSIGSGDHILGGDIAEVDFTNGARTLFNAFIGAADAGAGDSITATTGSMWIIGGQGADTISRGDGVNGVVIGDRGRIAATEGGDFIRIETTDHAIGSDDAITLGDGVSFVMGGRGGDTVTIGDGDHVILGDVGYLDFVGGIRSYAASLIETPSYGGDDSVTSGNGDAWIILGEGDDTLTVAGGFNIGLGDAGYVFGDTEGRYLQAETTQSTQGGNDSMTGGTGRDALFGGAGADFLKGNEGNDFLSGDGALLQREPTVLNGQITIESRDIRDGGDDTLIADDGFDLLMGGIGNDLFDLDIGQDVVVGEFIRLRLDPRPGEMDLVVSFLTPAMRDLDLLAQITLAMNSASGRTELSKAPAPFSLAPLGEMRLDLILVEGGDALDELRERLRDAGFDLDDPGEEVVPGLFGFGAIAEEDLLTGQVPSDSLPPESEGEAPPADEGNAAPEGETGAGAAAPDDEAQAPSQTLDTAAWDVAEAEAAAHATGAGGWKMMGWRVHTDAA